MHPAHEIAWSLTIGNSSSHSKKAVNLAFPNGFLRGSIRDGAFFMYIICKWGRSVGVACNFSSQ